MALRFFKDSGLTIPVTELNPLWIMAPLAGNLNAPKRLSLWAADDYSTLVQAAAVSGANTLNVLDTTAFASGGGSFIVDGSAVTYSAKAPGVLFGIAGLPAVNVNDPVVPVRRYLNSSLLVRAAGSSFGADLRLALKRPDQTAYGIPGIPALYSFPASPSAAAGGPVALFQIDLEFRVGPGNDQEFTDCKLVTTFFTDDTGQQTLVSAPLHIYRGDQGLAQRFRLLEPGRMLQKDLPGFTIGSFRWRDKQQVNQSSLTPWSWDPDVAAIGTDKFIPGIGNGDDLAVVGLEKSQVSGTPHSVFARIRNGEYFTGVNRYFMPSDNSVLEIFPASQLSFSLQEVPALQKPVFVGNYLTDQEGHFNTGFSYRYESQGFTSDSIPQFQLDRKTKTLTLNQSFSQPDIYMGVAPDSAGPTVTSLPVFPVYRVQAVYLPASVGAQRQTLSFSYEDATGLLTVNYPDGVAGRDVYVSASAGIAVLYQAAASEDDGTLLIDSVDLNPSFAGISQGFLYCEHRRHRSTQVVLSVDKPRILIPRSFEQVEGLVAFGPVYYENDFALLQVSVSGSESNDAVPGIEIQIVPDPDTFQGLVNYQDPTRQPVILRTGGDGVASFIYTPPLTYGNYLALSSISGSQVILPQPVAFDRLWNINDGWLTRLYQVQNDNSLFGKVGGDISKGEIVWAVSGTPGATSYSANGQRVLLSQTGGGPLQPVDALDASGVSWRTSPGAFSGNVKTLVYGSSLPSQSNIGAFFFAYIGQIVLNVKALDSGLISNQIILQLVTPPDYLDIVAGYLVLNTVNGRLEVNRLGGAPLVASNINTTRY